ncbi:hypothetical protein CRV03_07435 [Arcobacter sp. F155]|uniref:ABC transporter substrate-binding protein n=1 Tax=Arcobacter sp. F155 TaxID=2044512 RepID=UPI00100AF086|nr:ABC transporter substrate-binding protein [Arcobacter sp. F155]RXJ77088.1 hypothetical protein CRV03_07435 [Arcobacter sp. F155]
MSIKKALIYLFAFLPLLLFSQEKSIVIKDTLDRKVTINGEVQRVIALGTSLSFITYLNAMDKVIAVESIEQMDFDKRTYTYVNKNILKRLPVVAQGGSVLQLNYETILNLKPDVIFLISQNKKEADEISNKLNVPVVVLDYGKDGVNFNTTNKSLSIAGKVLKKEQRAKELIDYINKLRTSLKKPSLKKQSYIGALAYKGLQGIDSTQADFMPFELANVTNAVSKIKKKGHLFINDEFLLMSNPSNMFIDSACFTIVQEKFKKKPAYYNRLKAFNKSQVYLLLANNYYYTNFDQMLANSFFIAKTLYPKEYKNLNPIKKANEIFEMFVGKPLYSTIKNGLHGFNKVIIKNNQLELKEIRVEDYK